MARLLLGLALVISGTVAQTSVIKPDKFTMQQFNGPSGSFVSHPSYRSGPYTPGTQTRFVITVPAGQKAQVTIDPRNPQNFAVRAYDFVVMTDGALINSVVNPCVTTSYSNLGPKSVAYLPVVQAATTEIRTYTSGTNVAVVDFCVNAFNSGPQDTNMLGFQAFWSSVGTPAAAPTTTPAPSSTAATCGKPLILPSATPNIRIVNGVTVPSGGMPWAVALVQYGGQFCGATVIDKQWILTAGHCVEGSSEALMKSTTKAYLGTTNLLTASAANGNIKGISRVIPHPQYDVPAGSTNNDVALIKLDSPIAAWSNTLMPACLPAQPQTASKTATGSKNREIGYVTGWGTLYENQRNGGQIGSGSDLLQQTSIELFSAADCKALLPGYTITDKMICGGFDNGKYDSCQGDSGGPMVTQSDKGTVELTGVVSWGIGCAEAGKPGVYADVYALSPWIISTMAAN